ncbi:MAG: HEAT repeat domain-containing protein [Myxococcales bacterium]|nr:HEAT repeat domain-containing protein [Myxococcales bacterium]MCB9712840.1 HEAT repeat domain-containing protein [Myxococcales bacterium]
MSRSRRSWRSSLVAALIAALAASVVEAEPARWPVWPTEVRRISAALMRDVRGKELAGERQRVAALQALDRFATGAIVAPLLHSLDDSSPQVRREALRMCYEREVVACIPGAANLWSEGGEPTVRIAALRVLSLDPEPSRAAILIEALRDPSEAIRAQAADFLGSAPMAPDVRKRARKALLAKLADVSVTVRSRAVLSLGRLGPGDGTLSIARLLDDPEPTVRAAAAEALGRFRDPTAAPALRRAIATPNESAVALQIIEALALVPDPGVDEDLLALLDDPPDGVKEMQIGTAIGLRASPSRALVEGLVDRLDEPTRRDAALQALLMLGEDARGPLQAALARGLAPPIEVEVERLLAALRPDEASGALPPPWPDDADAEGWREQLERSDPLHQRRAAWTLAQHDPAWRVPMALASLEHPGTLAGRRGWAMTLAASPSRWSADDDAVPRARLEGWARDPGLAVEDRCLALAALGAHRRDPGRKPPAWADLSEDPLPRVRACTALALGRQGDVLPLEGLLVDSRARVRMAAALALAVIDPDRIPHGVTARLALLAAEDPEGTVRTAAALALDPARTGALPNAPGMMLLRAETYPWRSPPREVEVVLGERRLWLPVEGRGAWRWALVPGFAAAEAVAPAETLPARGATRSEPESAP